jgi:putative lipoprotein
VTPAVWPVWATALLLVACAPLPPPAPQPPAAAASPRLPPVALALAASAAAATPVRLRGAIVHRARIAMPPDTLAVVEVREATAAGRPPGPPVAEQRFRLDGRQVPLRFELAAEATALQAGRAYVLQAALVGADRPPWLSEPLAFTAGAGAVDIGNVAVSPYQPPRSGGEQAALLQGAEWRLTEIGSEPVVDAASAPSLLFGSDGRVSGSTGCNRFSAPYTLGAEGLRIGPAAATKRACAPPLGALEQRFLAQLQAVQGFELRGDGALLLVGSDARRMVAKR